MEQFDQRFWQPGQGSRCSATDGLGDRPISFMAERIVARQAEVQGHPQCQTSVAARAIGDFLRHSSGAMKAGVPRRTDSVP